MDQLESLYYFFFVFVSELAYDANGMDAHFFHILTKCLTFEDEEHRKKKTMSPLELILGMEQLTQMTA